MTLLEPRALWLLLSLPLIILLHLIHRRKQQQVVSALFLWREAKVLAQKRRRIAPSWLLLLQLLFAALVSLALARPQLSTAAAPHKVLVLDASASMAFDTLDTSDTLDKGGTRLAEAVRQAEAQLRGAAEVAVVRAGLGARVVQPPTADHAAVRRALKGLRAADAKVEVTAALDLAKNLMPGAEIHLFTDSAKPAGFRNVTVHPVGQNDLNVGVSAFALSYGELFVALASNAPAPQEVRVRLSQGDREVATKRLRLGANAQQSFSIPVAASGYYRAELIAWQDALALDNSAVTGVRNLRVQVRGQSPELLRVLRALPGIRVTPSRPDVIIDLAQGGPAALPVGVDAIVFAPAARQPHYQSIVDWQQNHPLLRFADLTGTQVALSTAPRPRALKNATVLARTDRAEAALLLAEQQGRTLLYLPFALSQSDLVRRPAFPIMLANTLESLRQERRVPLGSSLTRETYLLNPGQQTVDDISYLSAPLPLDEIHGRVTAAAQEAAPETTAPSAAASSKRNIARGLIGLAAILLAAEWLAWQRLLPLPKRQRVQARR